MHRHSHNRAKFSDVSAGSRSGFGLCRWSLGAQCPSQVTFIHPSWRMFYKSTVTAYRQLTVHSRKWICVESGRSGETGLGWSVYGSVLEHSSNKRAKPQPWKAHINYVSSWAEFYSEDILTCAKIWYYSLQTGIRFEGFPIHYLLSAFI